MSKETGQEGRMSKLVQRVWRSTHEDHLTTDWKIPVPVFRGIGQEQVPAKPTGARDEDAPDLLIVGMGHLVRTALLPVLNALPCIADCLDSNGKAPGQD